MTCRMSTGYVQRRNEGDSFAQIFEGGCIEIRTGAQPENADMAPTGDLLARITRNGGAWTAGSHTNGLRFDTNGRYVVKRFTDVWQLQGSATGTAGWCRLRANPVESEAASLIDARIDGSVALIGSDADIQLFLPVLAITGSTSIDINYWWFAPPPLPGD